MTAWLLLRMLSICAIVSASRSGNVGCEYSQMGRGGNTLRVLSSGSYRTQGAEDTVSSNQSMLLHGRRPPTHSLAFPSGQTLGLWTAIPFPPLNRDCRRENERGMTARNGHGISSAHRWLVGWDGNRSCTATHLCKIF
ncbi:hypothetical protein B0H67DRAFT_564530 [Lasiosphaeris hirsuta]|uniref:Secreted protein n=1 Tax=Lasiosphaeris hirsuta TaxID=260670 RepID=A0AA40BBR0_9PEZI|nr:hypothetical protein B0H67DRAFT_564530 [Lasiosphaeris hirsuta]